MALISVRVDVPTAEDRKRAGEEWMVTAPYRYHVIQGREVLHTPGEQED
jgi:hypothetical protein